MQRDDRCLSCPIPPIGRSAKCLVAWKDTTERGGPSPTPCPCCAGQGRTVTEIPEHGGWASAEARCGCCGRGCRGHGVFASETRAGQDEQGGPQRFNSDVSPPIRRDMPALSRAPR